MGKQVRNFTKYESIKSPKQGTGYRTGEKKKKETRPNYSLSVGDVHQSRWDRALKGKGWERSEHSPQKGAAVATPAPGKSF